MTYFLEGVPPQYKASDTSEKSHVISHPDRSETNRNDASSDNTNRCFLHTWWGSRTYRHIPKLFVAFPAPNRRGPTCHFPKNTALFTRRYYLANHVCLLTSPRLRTRIRIISSKLNLIWNTNLEHLGNTVPVTQIAFPMLKSAGRSAEKGTFCRTQ